MNISVKALLFFQDNILLLKPKHLQNSIAGWDGPGGTVEEGESLLDALVREIKEETGLDVSRSQCAPLTTITLPNNPVQYVVYIGKIDSDNVILSSEHTEYRWVSLEEFQLLTQFNIKSILTQTKELIDSIVL